MAEQGEARAKRIWARAVAIVAYAEPQPWSSLGYELRSQQTLAFLLKRSGMPNWLMGQHLRIWDDDIARILREVNEARQEPQLAAWLDGLAASIPHFHEEQTQGAA